MARPLGLEQGWEQAEKATSFLKVPFWGCPGLNLKANLPFDGMRPAYAAFEKEIPMAPQSTICFFKELSYYILFYFATKSVPEVG